VTQPWLDPSGAATSLAPSDADSGNQSSLPAFHLPDSYRHEALLWRGEEEFLDGTVPFIREGLQAGQPVIAAVTAAHIQLLRAALGADADLVHFADMSVLGRNPARIIPAWLEFIQEHVVKGQRARGIGEPIWPGRRRAEVAECQLCEALLNFAVDPHTLLWLLCPYDIEALAPDVIIAAKRTHPVLVQDHDHRRSTLYGASYHAQMVFEADLPIVETAVSVKVFGRDDLSTLREDVIAHALEAGLSPSRSAELALAVHEVATNSVKHGSGEGILRIWLEHDSLVCEIRDQGRITDPMKGRTAPAWDHEEGRGLWMANQLSDLVQVRSSAEGTTIRIHTWL
jgi:Anti-sigma regulatory factor (Ser/Thr protein kinase)